MKKTFLFLTVLVLMTSGCSKTWSGIKQDSHELLIDTKEVIHEATAPSDFVRRIPTLQNHVVSNQGNTIIPIAEETVQVFEDTPTVTTPFIN